MNWVFNTDRYSFVLKELISLLSQRLGPQNIDINVYRFEHVCSEHAIEMSLQDFKLLRAVAVKWSVRNLFGILWRLANNSTTVAFIVVWQSYLCQWHVTDNKHDVAGKCLIECQIQTLRMNAKCVLQCAISGFRHGISEMFALLPCYTV
jgi:hypothetical protein